MFDIGFWFDGVENWNQPEILARLGKEGLEVNMGVLLLERKELLQANLTYNIIKIQILELLQAHLEFIFQD